MTGAIDDIKWIHASHPKQIYAVFEVAAYFGRIEIVKHLMVAYGLNELDQDGRLNQPLLRAAINSRDISLL